jgi:uncharacterized Zn finger protein
MRLNGELVVFDLEATSNQEDADEKPAIQTNDEAYRRAVEFLRKVRGLMGRLGRAAEFSGYLESIRTAFKRKRNFIRMLDQGRMR